MTFQITRNLKSYGCAVITLSINLTAAGAFANAQAVGVAETGLGSVQRAAPVTVADFLAAFAAQGVQAGKVLAGLKAAGEAALTNEYSDKDQACASQPTSMTQT